MTLPDLIAALERADGPSRELDAEIDVAVKPDGYSMWCSERLPVRETLSSGLVIVKEYTYQVARYTASLDAALTLIPENQWFLMGAGKTRPDEPLYGVQIIRQNSDTVIAEAEHDGGLAIALCISALRARSVT